MKQHLVTLFELLDAWRKLKLGNNDPDNEPNIDCMRRGNARAPCYSVDDHCEGNVLLYALRGIEWIAPKHSFVPCVPTKLSLILALALCIFV